MKKADLNLVKPKQFLPDDMIKLSSELVAALEAVCPEHEKRYQIIYRTQPSTFIAHDKLKGKFGLREYIDWTLYGLVDAVVVERGSNLALLAIASQGEASRGQRLLEFFDVPCLNSDEPITGAVIRRALHRDKALIYGERRVLNPAEESLIAKVNDYCLIKRTDLQSDWYYQRAHMNHDRARARELECRSELLDTLYDGNGLLRANLYPQVCLSEIVDVLPLFEGSEEAISLARFAKSASVDVLVACRMDHMGDREYPVLAIEFDGKHHTYPRQIKKDNDKNDLLRKAEVPILRVKATHSWFDFEDACINEFLSVLIKRLVYVSRSLVDIRRRRKDILRKFWTELESEIRSAKRVQQSFVLDDQALDVIIGKVSSVVADAEDELNFDEWSLRNNIKDDLRGRWREDLRMLITPETLNAQGIAELDSALENIVLSSGAHALNRIGRDDFAWMCRALQVIPGELQIERAAGYSASMIVTMPEGDQAEISTPTISCELVTPADFGDIGDLLIESAVASALFPKFIALLDSRYGYSLVADLEASIDRVIARAREKPELWSKIDSAYNTDP